MTNISEECCLVFMVVSYVVISCFVTQRGNQNCKRTLKMEFHRKIYVALMRDMWRLCYIMLHCYIVTFVTLLHYCNIMWRLCYISSPRLPGLAGSHLRATSSLTQRLAKEARACEGSRRRLAMQLKCGGY